MAATGPGDVGTPPPQRPDPLATDARSGWPDGVRPADGNGVSAAGPDQFVGTGPQGRRLGDSGVPADRPDLAVAARRDLPQGEGVSAAGPGPVVGAGAQGGRLGDSGGAA